MKKILSFLALFLLVFIFALSADIHLHFPKLLIKTEGNEHIVLKYDTFSSSEDYNIFKPLPPYIMHTTSNRDSTNAPPPNDIKEEAPKAPFKPLNKYVTESELNEIDTVIKNVPLIAQFPNYPTGCETISAVSVLNFWGDDITVDKFSDKYLDKNINFYYKDGKRFGPSPYEYFLGNPMSENAWGCMSPVIAKALKKYINHDRVLNTLDKSLEEICNEYIVNGQPVVVWVSIHMMEITYTTSWYLEDGSKFSWPNNEHCMILIGYDDWYYYFVDPYVPATVRYKKEVAQNKFEEMGSQAIIIKNKIKLYQ